MADIAATAQAYLFTTQVNYGTWATTGAQPVAQALPKDLASNPYTDHRATVTQAKATGMVSTAIFIATNITSILKTLENSVKLADSSLTSPSANIMTTNQTRLSVGNIQAGLDQTLDAIAQLVDRAATGSANILSSTSSDITIQTSVYGGKINVAPQPFDLQGLGLENLNLHTPDGRKEAVNRLGRARLTADARLLNLKALQNGLGDPSAMSNAIRLSGATGGSTRGTVLNVMA